MDNIIAILTVCVTFLLGIMGLIANSMIQRKSNSISVITGTRLERRKTTQELAAKLLRYGDAEFLKTVKSEKEKAEAMEVCSGCVATLRSLYTFTVKEDLELVEAAEELKSTVYEILFGSNANYEKLSKRRDVFSKIVDIYLTTEWKRIKLETVGKTKKGSKSYQTWEAIWKANAKQYKG